MGQDVENRAVAADKVCVDISADPQVIFDLVHDYQRRLEWDPFLQEARLLGGAKEAGRGVRTLCVARSRLAGLGMETVYITYSPPRVAAVQMTRGPWFLKSFAAALRHESLVPGITRVVYCYHFRAKPRWLAPVLQLLLSAVFARETRRRLRGLKRALEGRPSYSANSRC